MSNASRRIVGFGLYEYDADVYTAAMARPKPELVERVLGNTEGISGITRTVVRGLRKADLAAMVAEWDTAARENLSAQDPEAEATSDADADAELLSFMRAVVELPNPITPITETDVRALDGSALVTLVQSGTRLIWGRLIAVVNRRTKYAAPLLATVEFPDGVRRLVSADDILVSDTFVAA